MKTSFNNTIATIKARFAAAFKTRSKRNAEMIEAMQLMYETRIDELECRVEELSEGFDQCVTEDTLERNFENVEWSELIDIEELLLRVNLEDFLNIGDIATEVMDQIDWDCMIADHNVLQAGDDLTEHIDMQEITDIVCGILSQRLLSKA